ncbi:MAG: c-type cytochrome [Bernardetiaceae bacterium]|nr:c-type cytochrome [Bernardetiaceae bacterium]
MKNLKYSLFAILAMLLPASAMAQEEASAKSYSTEELALFLLAGVILLVCILLLSMAGSIYSLVGAMGKAKRMAKAKAEGKEIEPEVSLTFGQWFWQKFNAAKPDKEVMLDHNYDGIRELDNDLPPWWKYGFYLSIIFALVYAYMHFTGKADDSITEYKAELAQAEIVKAAYLKRQAMSIDEKSVTALPEGDAGIANGKKIYMDNCRACHGDLGQGGVGPNLTDEYWIHGGDIKDIFRIVKYGVTEKGMLAWQSQLSPKEMQEVSSYILTLQGTNPPNAKEPQGEKQETQELPDASEEEQQEEEETTEI